jgi:hypothetical protein
LSNLLSHLGMALKSQYLLRLGDKNFIVFSECREARRWGRYIAFMEFKQPLYSNVSALQNRRSRLLIFLSVHLEVRCWRLLKYWGREHTRDLRPKIS